jgi:collagenase-like PrtC family protease
MKLIATTNWDRSFLNKLNGFPIEWILGRLPRDRMGSSTTLPSNMVRKINKKGAEEYIKEVHRKGFKFNYILDSICLGGIEYTYKGMDEILKMINWIVDAGVDGVTVSVPFFVKMIKKQFPQLSVGVNLSIMLSWIEKKIESFDDLGVDWIILPVSLNRDWRCLKNLTKRVKCELWLVANSGCLCHCPFIFEHSNFLSHLSNYTAPFCLTDYFNLNCSKIMIEKPYNLIKARWIRPEDLQIYEKLGYHTFVILPNTLQTEELIGIIKAYKNREYKGNLINLLSLMGKRVCIKDDGSFGERFPFVDNRLLEGFLDNFPDINCVESLCEECKYCINIAKKVVKFFDPKKRRNLVGKYEKAIGEI